MNPSAEELLLIGSIIAPFGVRGQVKVRAVTNRPDHLQRRIRTVYVGSTYRPYHLLNLYEHKPGLLVLNLEHVASRDAAEELRGAEIYILESEAAPLDEGEYFLHQLYNLRVETVDGVEVGSVYEVLETGSNEVLVVKRSDGDDALIPMIHDVVVELDLTGGRVVIRLLEGLL